MSTGPALIKMVNEIAANVPDRAHAAETTASHVRRFWSPVMIADLIDYSARVPDELSPQAAKAVDLLST